MVRTHTIFILYCWLGFHDFTIFFTISRSRGFHDSIVNSPLRRKRLRQQLYIYSFKCWCFHIFHSSKIIAKWESLIAIKWFPIHVVEVYKVCWMQFDEMLRKQYYLGIRNKISALVIQKKTAPIDRSASWCFFTKLDTRDGLISPNCSILCDVRSICAWHVSHAG